MDDRRRRLVVALPGAARVQVGHAARDAGGDRQQLVQPRERRPVARRDALVEEALYRALRAQLQHEAHLAAVAVPRAADELHDVGVAHVEQQQHLVAEGLRALHGVNVVGEHRLDGDGRAAVGRCDDLAELAGAKGAAEHELAHRDARAVQRVVHLDEVGVAQRLVVVRGVHRLAQRLELVAQPQLLFAPPRQLLLRVLERAAHRAAQPDRQQREGERVDAHQQQAPLLLAQLQRAATAAAGAAAGGAAVAAVVFDRPQPRRPRAVVEEEHPRHVREDELRQSEQLQPSTEGAHIWLMASHEHQRDDAREQPEVDLQQAVVRDDEHRRRQEVLAQDVERFPPPVVVVVRAQQQLGAAALADAAPPPVARLGVPAAAAFAEDARALLGRRLFRQGHRRRRRRRRRG